MCRCNRRTVAESSQTLAKLTIWISELVQKSTAFPRMITQSCLPVQVLKVHQMFPLMHNIGGLYTQVRRIQCEEVTVPHRATPFFTCGIQSEAKLREGSARHEPSKGMADEVYCHMSMLLKMRQDPSANLVSQELRQLLQTLASSARKLPE